MSDTIAELRLPTQELRDDIPFFTKALGMRLDMIYPADDPQVGGVFRSWPAAARRERRIRAAGNHPDPDG